jgi:hypothetical protein
MLQYEYFVKFNDPGFLINVIKTFGSPIFLYFRTDLKGLSYEIDFEHFD